MFIRNIDDIDKNKLFYCKSPNLKRFLIENHNIKYINKKKNGFKYVWVFLKTEQLDIALSEWSQNKKDGNFIFKNNKVDKQ